MHVFLENRYFYIKHNIVFVYDSAYDMMRYDIMMIVP